MTIKHKYKSTLKAIVAIATWMIVYKRIFIREGENKSFRPWIIIRNLIAIQINGNLNCFKLSTSFDF